MTTRTSPKAAHGRALKQVRARYRSMRLNEQVESPAQLADRLVKLLEPAAESDPAPPSAAYRAYVTEAFSNRFLSLCSTYPVRARRP